MNKDLECSYCGGLLYKCRCVRCNAVFTVKEIGEIFKQNLIDSCNSIKNNKEIKKIIKKIIY